MKHISYFFFYTYIGLVLLAGFWGAFLLPELDFRFMIGLDPAGLSDYERINLMSQYRFLRAMEFGFGLFSFIFRKEIFSEIKFNSLFLLIMLAGVLARVVSIAVDGSPNAFFYFFLLWEAIGVVFIFFYTRTKFRKHAGVSKTI